jgi:magnesium-transporting ATPase (P-type)
MQTEIEMHGHNQSVAVGKLPPEAPPPVEGFGLHVQSLKNLVGAGLGMKNSSDYEALVAPLLQRCGGSIEAIASKIKANMSGGLWDADSASSRKSAFGENRLPEKPMVTSKPVIDQLKHQRRCSLHITTTFRISAFSCVLLTFALQATFWELCLDALEDATLRILCAASIVSIILGCVLKCAATGWIEGFAIIVALLVVVVVTAGNDYSKERQFRALFAVADDRKILAFRNKSDQPVEISVYDIMVGDLLNLRTGDKIPADCYFLSGSDVKCSEAAITGESDDVKKGNISFADNGHLKSSPFFFSGTQVVEGHATALVLAVGVNSIAGSASMLMQQAEPETSPMQAKLDSMAEMIGKLGLTVAIITFLALIIRFSVQFGQKETGFSSWDHGKHWQEIMQFLITAITVLVVAIPEGLSLAVTISLAFSVKKMMDDNNLVRNLNSCETMGAATTICSDKTGTLTTNNMIVMRAYVTFVITAITIVFLGALIMKESPLRAIQLLWINLLMDSLASLALSTDTPDESLLDRRTYGRTKPLLSKLMCRNILFHAVYQIAVIFYFLYGLPGHIGISCGHPDCLVPDGHSCPLFDQACYCTHQKLPTVHYSMIFNVFVMMTLFNEVNMRKLENQRNVFQGILGNPIFWYVIVIIIIAQIILIEFGGIAFGTRGLSISQWFICIAFGAGTMIWHQIVIFFPCKWIPNGDNADDLSSNENAH